MNEISLLRGEMKMTISNPCYHCYMGAIGECLRCPISYKPWSEDLEHETIEIDDDIDDDKSIDKGVNVFDDL